MNQTVEHRISSHVLNTSSGLPASDMVVSCQILKGDTWSPVSSQRTDTDGRVRNFMNEVRVFPGTYRLVFETGAWFARMNTETFFPSVTVEFQITDAQRHHHVPLLLSAFGYSTYRGS